MTTQLLALNANWTNADVTLTNTSNLTTLQNTANTWWYGDYWYPYYRPIYPIEVVHTFTVSPPQARPIRLKMSEVEALRVAAKKDKAVREILEKFTDHIEVVVDFA